MLETLRADGRRLLPVGIPIAVFALVFASSLGYFRLTDGEGSTAVPAPAETSAGENGKLPAASGADRLVITLSAQTAEPAEAYLASVALDGSSLRLITKAPGAGVRASDHAPAVSPDGNTIAFARSVEGASPRVYLVESDGSGLRRLTRGPAVELDPAWSPDGKRVAFARQEQGHFHLFVCAPDGSGLIRLTRTSSFDEDWPAWSPDGTKIAFARWKNGFAMSDADLWLAGADGSGEMLLLGGPYDDAAASWAPDGRRIALLRNAHLAVMDADGTDLRQITDPGELKETRPSWSADGSSIVFTRDPGSILVVDPEGSHLRLVPISGTANGAVWAPSS